MMGMSEREFAELTNYIKLHYGINLTTKRYLVEGRLSSLIAKRELDGFSSYLQMVFSDASGEEMKNLINILTTNHTYFMRESNHFYYFRDTFLPVITKNIKNCDLRIWSAGCSSGEEPYTIAMILDEYFANRKTGWDTKILATDISTRVLDAAKKGIYTDEQIKMVPEKWKCNYFLKRNDNMYEVIDRIKDEIIFRRFNLIEKAYPFKKRFHVIFCRNVMIYFDYDTKLKLLKKLYDYLEPGGYLFVGYSESLSKVDTDFRYLMPSVYQRP